MSSIGIVASSTCGSVSIGYLQTIAEPDPLNVDVTRQQVQLAPQVHLGRRPGFECLTQQQAQTGNHAIRRLGIFMDQLGDRIQRIEQEMWLQLHAQQHQSRLCQSRFELGRAQLAFA